MNIYEIEPMYTDTPIELEYDVYYVNEPATWEYPAEYELSIQEIRHKGKPVSEEALIRLFSIHHGCQMTWEDIEEIILEGWEPVCEDYDADLQYEQWKEERTFNK